MDTTDRIELAVVGAHLSGMPLNHQLTQLGATLVMATTTSARYRLYALPFTSPPKPGLKRVNSEGMNIAVEVWSLPMTAMGQFISQVDTPLAIGTIELRDGQWVKGFVCEPWGLEDAEDVSSHGGWRAYIASRSVSGAPGV